VFDRFSCCVVKKIVIQAKVEKNSACFFWG
jgi:hypothetical protein